MTMDDTALEALRVVNFVALILFLALVGAILFSMARRLRDYRIAKMPVPVLLKRGFGLIVALAVIGGEAAFLRVLGVDLSADPMLRLIYVTQSDVILLAALAYYAKVELSDMDDPDEL